MALDGEVAGRLELVRSSGRMAGAHIMLMAGSSCYFESVPCVASLDAFHQAISEFAVVDPGLVTEPAALAAGRRSLDSSGLLLLGEMHGVRENPLLIRA